MDPTKYEEIGRCKITLKRAKKNISYSMVGLPYEYAHLVGKHARIYRMDDNSYLIVIQDGEKLHNPKGILSMKTNSSDTAEIRKNTQNQNGCRGRDEHL